MTNHTIDDIETIDFNNYKKNKDINLWYEMPFVDEGSGILCSNDDCWYGGNSDRINEYNGSYMYLFDSDYFLCNVCVNNQYGGGPDNEWEKECFCCDSTWTPFSKWVIYEFDGDKYICKDCKIQLLKIYPKLYESENSTIEVKFKNTSLRKEFWDSMPYIVRNHYDVLKNIKLKKDDYENALNKLLNDKKLNIDETHKFCLRLMKIRETLFDKKIISVKDAKILFDDLFSLFLFYLK